MKTTRINTTARVTGLAVALGLFAGMTGAASAADTVKGGERQMTLLGISTKALPSQRVSVAMACPKCKDQYSKRVDSSARGAYKTDVFLVKHLCESCDTTIATVGRGKEARDAATHKCSSCGSEALACCSTTKGSETPTKGM
jgi:hypothetical protein